MKSKPSSGTGMLSAAGMAGGASGTKKPGALLAPPPSVGGKMRSPLPPPPNDPAVTKMHSGRSALEANESTRRSEDSLSDLSQLEVRNFFFFFQF